MLDVLIRRYASPLFAAPAARIASVGIGAQSLTAAGFVLGLAALPAIGRRAYLVGLGVIVLSRLLDFAGEAMERLKPSTRFNAYLGLVLDVVWTASVPFAFALGQPDRALAAMFLMLGLVARCAAVSADAKMNMGQVAQFGAEFIGKAEIFCAFLLACLFPDWFSIIAYALGMACFVMTGFCVARSATQRR